MNNDEAFLARYNNLNDQQRAAVDQVDGPVMVVAGPGTGKTELLSMRVANILRQTDTDPSSILCLTFTESASTNMVKRLSSIIGQAAYRINIHTFHGFGTSIIGRYGEYFYNGAERKSASSLTQAEIIADILLNLPFDNPLNSVDQNGKPTYLSSVQSLIGDFKKSGLSPEQLRQILMQNLEFCAAAQPLLHETFGAKVSKNTIDRASQLVNELQEIANQQTQLEFASTPSLGWLVVKNLAEAVARAMDNGKTKPISDFKKDWLEANTKGERTLRDEKRSLKTLAAVDVYEKYNETMTQRGLYDYNDMILQVINAMRNNQDLKANLQEQYQYILVDEFQDTNDAQMALLNELTDYDDQPNLMVVGDDDQAIYRFQGADISNIQNFARHFPTLRQINLSINYRSEPEILELSSQVAQGIEERLTNIDGTTKQLIAGLPGSTCQISLTTATTTEHELDYVADRIEQLIATGASPSSIAVIARKHKSLENLSYYLARRDISINYEHQRDVFQSPLIQLLLHIAETIDAMREGSATRPDEHLAHIIADPSFSFSSEDFYQISLKAQRDRQGWVKALDNYSNAGHKLVAWLKGLAQASQTESLNSIILKLMGITALDNSGDEDIDSTTILQPSSNYKSPVFDYYFSTKQFKENTLRYLNFLSDYNCLINALGEFKPDTDLHLTDLLDFVNKSLALSQPIYSANAYGNSDGVQLMSVHKAKGMEFDTVFIIDAENSQWSKGGNSSTALPINLPIGRAGDSADERRRVFFVAITRAKHNLFITAHAKQGDKELEPLEYTLGLIDNTELPAPTVEATIQQLTTPILAPVLDLHLDRKQLLAQRLENYKLSASDLNAFTNLENAGPEAFLQNNLLRVPSASSAPMLFGNAVHAVMEKLHNYAKSDQHPNELPPLDETLQAFRQKFQTNDLSEAEAKKFLDKGEHAIKLIYEQKADEFKVNQKAELKLDATLPNGVRLTGKLDAAEFDQTHRTVIVTDYKTGKPFASFEHPGNYPGKAHRYSQQLLFYKLLLENSPEYHDWRVVGGALEFVEPVEGEFVTTAIDYSTADMEQFIQLITSVWQHIQALDLPNVSAYPASHKGTLAFESDLIAGVC